MRDFNLTTDLIPDYGILCSLNEAQNNDTKRMVIASNTNDVLEAINCGYNKDEVFFIPTNFDEAIEISDKCRMIITNLELLQQIDTRLVDTTLSDKLITVGLSVVPNNYKVGGIPAFTMDGLSGIVRELRQIRNISIRGVFFSANIECLHGKELGRYFRCCYETSKCITTLLPCIMPYICFGDCLDAIEYNIKNHPDTLPEFIKAAKIVAQQNSTAFYAKLLIK